MASRSQSMPLFSGAEITPLLGGAGVGAGAPGVVVPGCELLPERDGVWAVAVRGGAAVVAGVAGAVA